MSDPKHAAIVTAPHSDMARMHPVVSAAISAGADASQLRELLAVQRDWEAGEARKAFTSAMVALKREMPTVLERDTTVDFSSSKGRTTYKHTSLGAAVDTITPHLSQHGFSFAWIPSTTDRAVTVTCRLTHADGHSEETTISAPHDASGGKSAVQGVASTITLLSRYTLLSLLGIATADMKDPAPAETPRPDGIDTTRNMRAVGWLEQHGRSRSDAEQRVGRRVSEWTAADLDALRAWARPTMIDPTERQPGDD